MNEHAGGVTGQTKGPRHVCDYCWVAGAVTCLVTVNGDQLLPSCGYTFAVTSRANVPVAAVLNVAEPDPLLIDPFDARLNPFRLNVALNHPFAVGLTPTAAVQVCPVHNKLETDNVGTVTVLLASNDDIGVWNHSWGASGPEDVPFRIITEVVDTSAGRYLTDKVLLVTVWDWRPIPTNVGCTPFASPLPVNRPTSTVHVPVAAPAGDIVTVRVSTTEATRATVVVAPAFTLMVR